VTQKDGAWLITGGAGYIGAHVVREFANAGIRVIVIDNLSTGIRERIPDGVTFTEGDCSDESLVRKVLITHEVTGIVHLAAFKHARESARQSIRYWSNNLGAMLGVINAIQGTNVRFFLLSSSCAVFGASGFVDSDTKPNPQSTYARTKYSSEQILADCATEIDLSWMSLRYFNVIGNGDFPHAHDTSTECLIPAAYAQIQRQRPSIIFGTNFDTPDGTALRDYVDVRDLAAAHVKAASYLTQENIAPQRTISIGTGTPNSVLELLTELYNEVQRPLQIDDSGRHPSDPEAVWADAKQAKELLAWEPKHSIKSSIAAHVISAQRSED